MKIFRALGFGLAIIILRSVMPDVFHALEHTLLALFDTLSTALSLGKGTLVAGALIPAPHTFDYLLPH